MLTLRFAVWMFSVGIMGLGTGAAYGQDFPSKPIRIITSGAGGASDIAARLIGQGISPLLGQPVIVDNRAAGVILGDTVAKSPPDGYTLLLYSSAIWLGPFMQNTPYDPVRDFSPITFAFSSPNILVVHPSLPVKSVKELIALAKAKPGVLNFGTSGVGGSSHLAGELFKAMTGVNIVRINYKGAAMVLNDLLGGQIQLSFATPGSAAAHIKSGRLRAVAVTSAQPSALLPGLPTIAASGVPGYESVGIFAVFAPAKTPEPIINRLNQEMVRVLKSADVREKLLNAGVETVGSSPGELAATIKSEMARMGKVIKDAGIRTE